MTPRINVVGLVVADMNSSVDFYRRLGFEAERMGPDHAEAPLPGGMRLTWDTEAIMLVMDPEWVRPVGGARMSLAFDCGSPDDVDSVYADLVAAGARVGKPPWDAVWRQRYAIVYDPDGNSIDLYAAL